ncbi:DNA polymerase III subunit gamma/tau [Pseudovibrio sp. Tun.PSC04-5.I4]|uniref:DNA polymerase III subunit gamma/tau n=1 Tax=Pseudovibrio sp. Tun.PSC04-5.I4 TaxID=1798213 RepID=UPI00088D8E09|nr:DNA polymerase III subunit gamma/tau [Pseudovibrio sp. Tun.PSC04-5.I4]SDR24044.1 DNA polymerase III, tau subunit [Pseudovibrio sp. Tun.PSC04-5.I4]
MDGTDLQNEHQAANSAEAPASGGSDGAYRVLARKYRPSSFDDLYGQEPMVQTLQNAFETGRIAHAWMLTGVRGVGKTTTARILARGLNYEIPGEIDKATIHLDKLGVHCKAIMEGRHVDVIEMDAASHTGIDDIREITEAARYRPASARYKVYIIDEVHMLSKSAFNGLLKTLEEPPEHVKFIFATTEIRKVPVTVLSRCQRFDLRRIESSTLVSLLRAISGKEGIEISDEALALIARAGEGSARDCLSLLDQAIAHGAGRIEADEVRQMLGLADRSRVIDLFEHVMRGDIASALDELKAQYEVGADPAVVLSDLADFTHLVTRLKAVPKSGDEASVTESERLRGREFAEKLSMRILSRTWQILLKGINEVQTAPKPLAAADMVLVRLCYASDLPDPEEALKLLKSGKFSPAGGGAPAGNAPQGGGGSRASAVSGGGGSVPQLRTVAGGQPMVQAVGTPAQSAPQMRRAEEAQEKIAIRSWHEVAQLAAKMKDIPVKVSVERALRLVNFQPGRIEVQPTEIATSDAAGELGRKLTEWTGRRWIVAVSREQGRPTLHEEKEANQRQLVSDAHSDPEIVKLIAAFPGAKVVDVRILKQEEDIPLEIASDVTDLDPAESMDFTEDF